MFFRTLARFDAADIIASAGVTVGLKRYMCLKNTFGWVCHVVVPQFLVGQMVLRCIHDGRTVVRTLRCVLVYGIGLGGSVGVSCGILAGTRDKVGSCRLYR